MVRMLLGCPQRSDSEQAWSSLEKFINLARTSLRRFTRFPTSLPTRVPSRRPAARGRVIHVDSLLPDDPEAKSNLALSHAAKMPPKKVAPRAGGHCPCRPKIALALAVVVVLVSAVAGASPYKEEHYAEYSKEPTSYGYKASYGQDYDYGHDEQGYGHDEPDYGHDEPDYGYEAHKPAKYKHRYLLKTLGSHAVTFISGTHYEI